MKKKLLVFHPTIAPYRIDFFNSLNDAFDMRICLLNKNLKSQSFDQHKLLEQCNFNPIYLKRSSFLMGRISVMEYWRFLHTSTPDVVLTVEFSWSTLASIFYRFFTRRKYRIVSICDDSFDMIVRNNDFSWKHRIARRIITSLIDNLILVEPKVVEWYLRHYGKGLFFPIIRDELKLRTTLSCLKEKCLKTKHQYQLEGKTVFLVVGRLVKVKNVETILRAFSSLDQKACALVIVGDGTERNVLECVSRNLNVCFTGRLEGEELYQWYNLADCFVLASSKEPFGAVVNEALIGGCYCLVSNKAGASCLIKEGMNGMTFSPFDEEELSRKMMEVSNRTSEKRGDNGLRQNRMLINYGEKVSELIKKLQAQ